MAHVIELSDDQYAGLEWNAYKQGVTVDEYIQRLLNSGSRRYLTEEEFDEALGVTPEMRQRAAALAAEYFREDGIEVSEADLADL